MWRRIQDDEIWINPEPFNKRDAWIDLLLMTWAKDKNFIIGKKVVELKDGQIFLSYRYLSSKWHWSKHKIGDYLSLLRDLKKVIFEPHPEGTLITICKWETYQGIFDGQGTLTNSERGHLGDAQGTLRGHLGDKTKNVKEDVKEFLKKDKENTLSEPQIGSDAKKLLSFFGKLYKNLYTYEYHSVFNRDTKILKTIRQQYDFKLCQRIILLYFHFVKEGKDEYLKSNPSIPNLKGKIPFLVSRINNFEFKEEEFEL